MAEIAEKGCNGDGCDIFDFMSTQVGLSVLHPGGLEATRRLAESCRIDGHTKVVDIACGKGTGAVYLARRYGCEVVGVDICGDSIAQATDLAKRTGLDGKVTFRVGDALELPFSDGEFDVAISQAVLVLVDDKQKAVQEALRVVRPGGTFGWLELSWKKQPTEEFLATASNVLCASCMLNVHTFPGWEGLFKRIGVHQLEIRPFDLERSGMLRMLPDEGLVNTGRVMLKYLTNGRIRKRMSALNRFIADNSQYFGYGIYTGRK